MAWIDLTHVVRGQRKPIPAQVEQICFYGGDNPQAPDWAGATVQFSNGFVHVCETVDEVRKLIAVATARRPSPEA
jgi:hypothetical protein